jgi:hypothetical protein
MRKSLAAVSAVVLITVALTIAGCSSWFESPAKPANDKITVANQHLKLVAAKESEVASGGASLQRLPYTQSGAKQALAITSEVAGALKSARGELLSAKAAMDGIATLEVSSPFKQFAKLESAAIDARVALVDAESRLYDAMDRLYSALSKTSNTVDMQDTITAIQRMQQEVAALADTASQAAQTAADYFTRNKLGG